MFQFKEKYDINDLRLIMKELRSEHGCPWDKKQDHESIKMDVIKEAYELLEAIDNKDTDNLKEELGDVLFQIIFHSELESEKGTFDLDDVCDGICKKMIYRHPHVFGGLEGVETPEQVLRNWAALKAASKNEKKASESFSSVPKALPALMRAEEVGKRAADAGMDFVSTEQVIDRLKTEITELENALASGNDRKTEEELGDILFSCTNLSRFLKKDSEKALTIAINKFIIRFSDVEELLAKEGRTFSDASAQELDDYWERVKGQEQNKSKE